MKHPLHETETDFQRAIIQLAEKAGWRVYHVKKVKGQLRNSTSLGFPDLCMAHHRWGVVFAELKGPKGKTTPAQDAWYDYLTRSGQHAYVWRPKDWPTVVSVLYGVRK